MFTAPKPKRIKDSVITRKARNRDCACLYGLWHKDGCKGILDGHHIIPVGVGGPDVVENVISLCRWHHTLAEARRIDPGELCRLMTVYHNYQYDDLGQPILSDVGNTSEA